ncbi:hypothetical protein ACOJIU_11760 [Carnobacterium maltaromaticum]|uniref:hypothetical protein n=1 Tax=Carnobacterium maltaromaticum TaxID=2751 RepID=UPI003B981405
MAELHGVGTDNYDKAHPYVNLKYYDSGHQCFSEFEKDELKQFSELCRKFGEMDWVQLKKQSGKGPNKTGMAPTMISRGQLPKRPVLEKLSPDIDFMELRLSQTARIFGFRSNAAFFAVFLDRNHDLT